MRLRPDFAPDPTGGAYSAPQAPWLVFSGPLRSRGGEGKKSEGREEEGAFPHFFVTI